MRIATCTLPALACPLCLCPPRTFCASGVETQWQANDVQGTNWPEQKAKFDASLSKYIANGFDRSSSSYAGADFAQGCGNMVNNGDWTSTSHGETGRLANFDGIIALFKAAGMAA